ncbi:MAG: hypothetical protein GY710_19370 [Desulfobacteraceae bacterium]|nr:hypothetical protein [Desulfobacteraceae bacterium]
MPFVKTMISEGRLAEFHLKNLIKETDDKSAKWTLAAIHYSKFIIIISLISGIVFAVIQAN